MWKRGKSRRKGIFDLVRAGRNEAGREKNERAAIVRLLPKKGDEVGEFSRHERKKKNPALLAERKGRSAMLQPDRRGREGGEENDGIHERKKKEVRAAYILEKVKEANKKEELAITR